MTSKFTGFHWIEVGLHLLRGNVGENTRIEVLADALNRVWSRALLRVDGIGDVIG